MIQTLKQDQSVAMIGCALKMAKLKFKFNRKYDVNADDFYKEIEKNLLS